MSSSKALKIAPHNVVEKVAWLHYNDRRQVLFARSRGERLAYTVGGKPNTGEMLVNALVREVKEETGVDLVRRTIERFFVFEGPCHGYVEGTKLKMYCYTAQFEGTPMPMAEVEELVYLDSSDIGQGRTTAVGDTILEHLNNQGLIGPGQYTGL